MDNMVKQSVDSRKQAMLSAYKIEDKIYLEKIDDLFKRISEFGDKCLDSSDFENKFSSSPLNKEYIDLFTELSQNCMPNIIESNTNDTESNDGVIDDIKTDAKMMIDDLTMPARHAAREEFDSKVRDVPIVGDAIQAKQTFDLFKRFKKNK